jgi:hypothetical protein
VLVCGASFAGLVVAREIAGTGADVLVVDRYDIGERATSACAAPTPWLHAMGVAASIRQESPAMTFTTPHGTVRYRLPWSWSAFDYRARNKRRPSEFAGRGARRRNRREPSPYRTGQSDDCPGQPSSARASQPRITP